MVCNNMVFSIFFLLVVHLMCFSDNLYCSGRDTITSDTPVIDDGSEGLISAGGEFELGFFTPKPIEKSNSAANRRYVGIWYHDVTPRTFVWVANRNDPIPANSTGVLAIEGGNLCLLDNVTGYLIWNTELEITSSNFSMMAQLLYTGNLVLVIKDSTLLVESNQWQSFQNPTDTFIPGMLMNENLKLTSWRKEDDPGTGNFTFKQDEGQNWVILKNSVPYWKNGEPGIYLSSDEMSPEVTKLLKNSSNIYRNYTRLVIHFTGMLKGLTWKEDMKQWDVFFFEPNDPCSVVNPCGNFGICNTNNSPLVCKCLPGFKPQSPNTWDSGDFSGGCLRESTICGKNDTFLNLRVKTAGRPDATNDVPNETLCRNACLGNCQCQAYSYAPPVNVTSRDTPDLCYIWASSGLSNLVEEDIYGTGHILAARVASFDLGSTVKDCMPCGTTMVPYPLSTGLKCGDPMYQHFQCNIFTGNLSFLGPDGYMFDVINISPSTQRFSIHSKNVDSCDSISTNRVLNLSTPFKVIRQWCSFDLFISEVNSSNNSPVVIEIGWEPPQEPTCTTLEDCRDWPHSTCSLVRDGKKICLCSEHFKWNGSSLNCTQEGDSQGILIQSNNNSRKNIVLPLVVVAVLISGIFLGFIIYCYIRRRQRTKRRDHISHPQLDSERQVQDLIDTSDFKEEGEKGIDVPFYDFGSILDATDNFSVKNKLGQGGYGPVYKGKFPGGQEMAVKRLSRGSGQGLQEFKNEVVLIAKLQHRNLVRLKGYCMKGEEKILLYEYMPNKSLDSFIFDHSQNMFIDWNMRFNIILGIGRGLLYLHQDSRLRIIHRDLKTSNILLDEEMTPKISDFGLARIVGGKETEANTNTVVGTYGYMSPEYALDGTFSVKSDVFSFGVVLLEIVSGKKNSGIYQSKQTFNLIGYVWELWTENNVLDLMDRKLSESCNKNQFVKYVNVGLLCVQEDPSDRPTMSNVVTMLDSETAILPAPKQPAFLIRRGNSSTASSSTKPETNSEMTMTLEGR